ncbi:HupE/UreJ family protein [Croceicoccus gelatinilyticus]|uniref:HupE/UreJ family protein n=1 Tax=Croceicoccus gelatinilyticus TaxID=2835536 RepID=UPI001BCE17DF|nr:HupE/UreJ family protein [Croceicoccus gelatinilyticus]MBS7671080.1 HupE/UreJ family protein [Croceicoccus gelatinilyticus]
MAAVLLVWSHTAAAHLTPNSEIRLQPVADGYVVKVIVPAAEYAYASGNKAENAPAARAAALDYLQERFRVTGADGEVLPVTIGDVRFARVSGPADLLATARIEVPSAQAASKITLHWSAVIDRVPDHFALVIRDDGSTRQVLGSLRQVDRSLHIDPIPLPSSGLLNAISLGASHIVSGFDHLLFLLALLISAPLIARNGSWVGMERPGRALWNLAKVTSGFTLGHSVTLIAAGLANWALPVAPVEALIALSVIITAVHAIRPLFPGREACVATGFGLIHGLAFATLAAGSEGMPAQTLTTLLGFNIGIELVQLAVLAAALPILFLLMRNERFATFRTVAGAFTAICGGVWLLQRMPGLIA